MQAHTGIYIGRYKNTKNILKHSQTNTNMYKTRPEYAIMHAYMNTHIHTYAHTRIHAYMHVCMHDYIYANRTAKLRGWAGTGVRGASPPWCDAGCLGIASHPADIQTIISSAYKQK